MITRRALTAATLALAAFCTVSRPALAQEDSLTSGTLKTIKDRGTILVGVRDSSIPFSYHNKGGQPVGYAVDICHGIAQDVATALGRQLIEADAPAWERGVRIVYVPVTAENRLSTVQSGGADLECGSTTANAERAKSVAFSPIYFMAGTKLLTPVSAHIGGIRDLAGKTIVTTAGTTNGPSVKRALDTAHIDAKMVEAPDHGQAYAMLESGKADAYATDDVLLSGFVATKPDGHKFHIVGDYLSFEPYGIMFRKDDPQFAALVKASFARMASEGALTAMYNEWFTKRLPSGENLELPMSPQLYAIFGGLGQNE